MALYFQWDSGISISECEKELDNYQLTITGMQIADLINPYLFGYIAWGTTGYLTERAYNTIFCVVRNTKGKLDTLYGQQ